MELNSCGPHPSLEIEKEIRCVVFTSYKQCRINKFDQISRLCLAGRGEGGGGWGKDSKEIYQTRATRAKFVVWLIKPIAF